MTTQAAFDVLHFSTVFPGRGLPRLVRRIQSRGVRVVYDLEDTHWIPTDTGLTAELKRRARLHLAAVLDSPLVAGSPFGVKVNAFGTEDGARDLAMLASLAGRHRPRTIVLPKVEDAETVEAFLRACEGEGVMCDEVVPLIETKGGVNHLDDFLRGLSATTRGASVRRLMYGANDHCLDSGRWPFWTQNDPAFWETVQGLVGTIETHGFRYVHTPFAGLRAPAEFTMAIRRLMAICGDRFAISTLDEAQTIAALAAPAGQHEAPEALRVRPFSDAEALALAQRIVRLFDERRRPDLGFVVDSHDGRFIPPHEYVAALRYIEQGTRARP